MRVRVCVLRGEREKVEAVLGGLLILTCQRVVDINVPTGLSMADLLMGLCRPPSRKSSILPLLLLNEVQTGVASSSGIV